MFFSKDKDLILSAEKVLDNVITNLNSDPLNIISIEKYGICKGHPIPTGL